MQIAMFDLYAPVLWCLADFGRPKKTPLELREERMERTKGKKVLLREATSVFSPEQTRKPGLP